MHGVVASAILFEKRQKPIAVFGEADGPVKVAFAANGTVDPAHRIWIYPDGSTPEKGYCIEVDRFGEPRCRELEGGER